MSQLTNATEVRAEFKLERVFFDEGPIELKEVLFVHIIAVHHAIVSKGLSCCCPLDPSKNKVSLAAFQCVFFYFDISATSSVYGVHGRDLDSRCHVVGCGVLGACCLLRP